MTENELSYKIIGAALEVHRSLGVGLLENTYEIALLYELKQLGLDVQQQVALPLIYKDVIIENTYKIDLFIEGKVIVEIKSVLEIHPIFQAQLLTYLKLAHMKLGLLINFNTLLIKHGIHRVVNNL
ncbi:MULTISPECIES: GxxExxY protein [Chryseobacterium]|uniref:GxxExxY protein n=1 Tax=Chryseobacterium endophyticum TaxID=1854762 RepID=A0AAU6WV07_9FLAO